MFFFALFLLLGTYNYERHRKAVATSRTARPDASASQGETLYIPRMRAAALWGLLALVPVSHDGGIRPQPRAGHNLVYDSQRRMTLLVNGDHDLSTPLQWAREELRYAPKGRLVVVPGAGHSVQSRARNDVGRNAVAKFLLG